jgi:hypothetical protein
MSGLLVLSDSELDAVYGGQITATGGAGGAGGAGGPGDNAGIAVAVLGNATADGGAGGAGGNGGTGGAASISVTNSVIF